MTTLAHPRPSFVAWIYRTVMRRWVALWLLIGVAIHLGAARLPLGTDEAGDSFIAMHWGNTAGSLYGRYWVDRPPILLVTYLAGASFGPFGLRALAGIFAIATAYVVYRLTERIAGKRAARCAMPLAVLTLSSGVIGSIFATGEMFAVLPGAASVYFVITTRDREHRWRWLVLAGTLGMLSLLTKQSFADAMAAAATYFIAELALGVGRGLSARNWLRDVCSYTLGALVPVGATIAWAFTTSLGTRGLTYALFGFRVDALRALAHSTVPLSERFAHMGVAAIGSGMVFLIVCSLVGLWHMRRRDAVVTIALGGWLAAGLFGVLGGGYYWPHYLIQLVPVCAVLTGIAITRWRRRFVGIVLVAVAVATVTSIPISNAAQHPTRTLSVAHYLHEHAAPGDSLYVMYARANLVYYANMPTPYPYLWSSMLRAKPDAQPRLQRWLASNTCPTWIVEWQQPTAFGMDQTGRTRQLLERNYRQVSTVRGVPIMHRARQCSGT